MLLGEISQIRTGLVLSRRKIEGPSEAKYLYEVISIRNIDEYGRVVEEVYETLVTKEPIEEGYLTKEGDLLMRLSYPYTTVVIDKNHEGLVIPSYFGIIRKRNEVILSEYLGWYLGRESVKEQLKNKHSGVKISGTNKKNLEAIEIKILSVEQQERVIELYRYFLEEQDIMAELVIKKKRYFCAKMEQILESQEQ